MTEAELGERIQYADGLRRRLGLPWDTFCTWQRGPGAGYRYATRGAEMEAYISHLEMLTKAAAHRGAVEAQRRERERVHSA